MSEAASVIPDAVPRRALASHPRVGAGAVLVGALLFAANATASKLAMEAGLAASQLVQLRTAGTAVVLFAVLAVTRPDSLKIAPRDLAGLAAYGIVGIAFVQFLYSLAIARLPVGLALLLEYTAPLMVAAWVRVVWHQRLRRTIFAALALCLVGLALVAQLGRPTGVSPVGVAAALGAAVCLAAYFVMGSHMVRRRDVYSNLAWSMGFAAALWTVAAPPWLVDWGSLAPRVSLGTSLHISTVVVLAFVVVGGTALPYFLELWALGPLGPARTSLLAMAEPALAAAIAWVALGETMTAWQVVGGLAVLAGIALAELSSARTPAPVLPR